ncbi:metal-dependent hydrolase [Natrinema ejinorense]|uniref:Hydrolase n=1 Tax=Natrinema ejinorense TaxID=373386 RepID=A0A2A5QTS9_9EURY|nr:metal-dependent hydrolase [Natrinema ejinorense]PCR90215.1 hydrolase [Natrinema ejinorense]
MWPWEHAIVAYLLYSLCCHTVFRDSPGGLEAFAVVVAAVLPDLIDKPLAWEYGVFDVGYGIGHSIFFAVPLAILAGTIARAATRPRVGLAFGLGYLSHPLADIVDSLFRQGVLLVDLALWPIASVAGSPPGPGVLEVFLHRSGRYVSAVLAGDVSTYLWIQLALAGATMVVWLLDGAPVARECLQAIARAVGGILRPDAPSNQNETNRR